MILLNATGLNAQDTFSHARNYFNRSSFELCLKCLDSCANQPLFADSALYLEACIAIKLNQYDKATGLCNELHKRNKNFNEVWFLRGLIASLKNKYALAAEQYTKLLNKQPDHLKALYNRALAKGSLDDLESAIADLDKCISLNPAYTSAYYSRGYWHEALQHYEAAVSDYSKTLALDANFNEAYLPLAYVLNKKGDKQKACEILQHAFDKGVNAASDLKDIYCK